MLSPDFKEFAELLNAHGVDYLVVGGYALAVHGHPRYTGDIDFTSIDGVEFEDCFGRRELVEVSGLTLNFIGLEDFRSNKRASGRFKDLADLDSLDDKD